MVGSGGGRFVIQLFGDGGCLLLVRFELLGLFCLHAPSTPPPAPCGRGERKTATFQNTPFVLAQETPQPLLATYRQHVYISHSNIRKSCLQHNVHTHSSLLLIGSP